MTQTLLLQLLAAAVLGGVVGWLITALIIGRRRERQRLELAGRLSAAEAQAAAEREHRQALDRELEEAQEQLSSEGRELAVARERVEAAKRLAVEQQQFLERSRKELEDSFKSLAAAALQGSSKQFLELAEQRLHTARTQASADLDERKKAIETLLTPFKETLGRLDSTTQEIEKARVEAYSRMREQVEQLAMATSSLQEKTTSLATALRGSQVRGRWGEIALRNIAELAGMSEHCDFEEQTTVGDGKRPDMTVRLPGGRWIAVDAKAPLTAYLEAVEATDDAARKPALVRHVQALKGHIKTLAARDYAAALDGEVDLVVMFLPGDPFLSAAFAQDPDLQVEALRSKVLVATPTTLVALLRTVAFYWQQVSLAENAEVIAAAARELYERAAKFGEELGGVGKGLKSALDAYNRAVGSYERRLMPMGRKLADLKVTEQLKRDLEEIDPLEVAPRELKD